MPLYTNSPLGLINELNIGSYSVVGTESNIYSIFSSSSILRKSSGYSNISDRITSSVGDSGSLHKDDVYDISTNNILTKLSQSGVAAMKLKAADLAYCKNYGVYPNNRLIICRRFATPVGNDLTTSAASDAMSTLVSWLPEDSNILEFTVSEEWIDAEVSFKEILNDIGKDIGMKSIALGDMLDQGAQAVPLPGATEILQRKILKAMGIISSEEVTKIPAGDPNLIKEAKVRKLIEPDQKGSGLVGKLNLRVKFSWEQKFIANVDPTVVFLDLMNTILTFGTSNSNFYLGKNKDLGNKLQSTLNKMEKNPLSVVSDFISALSSKFGELLDALDKAMTDSKDKDDDDGDGAEDDTTLAAEVKDQFESLLKNFTAYISQRYRIPILGIFNSLTGLPSTPWHITIGNPLRPILSSGDMLCKDVKITLGPQLAFNDLPSTIECELVLESARNLGLQEIMERFNCGQLRTTEGNYTSDTSKSFWNSDDYTAADKGRPTAPQQNSVPPSDNRESTNVNPPSTDTQTKIGNTPSENDQVNPDANSDLPFINLFAQQ